MYARCNEIGFYRTRHLLGELIHANKPRKKDLRRKAAAVETARPGVCVCDFRFVPPWPDYGFQTLPTTDSCRGVAYVLPNKWEFSRHDVLNFRFKRSGWRLPLTPVEGLLGGWSRTP